MGARAPGVLRKAGLAGLLALSSTVAASQAAGDWRLERDRDGITIHTRAVGGASIREIRGSTRIRGRLSSVVAVLHDPSAGPELSDLVYGIEVRDRDSQTRYRIYSAIDMPWPVSDRELLNQREIVQDAKTLAVTITDVATTDLVQRKGFVRMTDSRQQWTLTPLPGGDIGVELLLYSDPGGPMPASLINAMSVNQPYDMLRKLAELAGRPEYREAQLSFITEPADP